MKKIICFDSWTEGAHNFERLVLEFRKNNFELILIHFGSYGHDLNRPIEERIGNLLVRDISFYNGLSLLEILKTEKPAVILFLSTRALLHMAVIVYANYLKIPTCHLYHGVVNVQATNQGDNSYKTNLVQQLVLVLGRVRKNFFILIPFYISSLFKTKASFYRYFDVFAIVFQKLSGKNAFKRILKNTQTTIGCVYVDADISHMELNYGIKREKIFVVGNPDLINFGFKESDILHRIKNKSISNNYVLYIDTALSKSGFVFSSDNSFIEHILILNDKLTKAGYKLLVKLHPAHRNSTVPDKLLQNGILLSQKNSFISDLRNSLAVIVEPSSAALIPAYMGIPIFLAKFGELCNQSYGKVLIEYPLSTELNNIDELKFILKTINQTTDLSALSSWLDLNIGPVPFSDFDKRVVASIKSIENTQT